MTKHIYQPGDRVVLVGITKATLIEIAKEGMILKRDDGILGYGKDGGWFAHYSCVAHDTDIQPGDWVRHESVNGEDMIRDGWVFQVKVRGESWIGCTSDTYSKEEGWNTAFVCNVVKIDPLQKEEPVKQPKRVTIRHAEFGTVEECERWSIDQRRWFKQGAHYFHDGGWSEVPQKRDVTGIEWNVDALDPRRLVPNNQLYEVQKLPLRHEWRKAKAIVLPEGMTWEEFWGAYWADKNAKIPPEHACERLSSTIIQVWKEGK